MQMLHQPKADIVLLRATQEDLMTGVWTAYRDVYDSLQATAAGSKHDRQLFDIGAAIADKQFSKAVELTNQLRAETVHPGQLSLGWAPTMAVDVLLEEMQSLV